MFNRTPPEKTELDNAIDSVLMDLRGHDTITDEFAKSVTMLERLHKLRLAEKQEPRVSPDTWVTVGAHLAGILMIVGYERSHVITSRALNFMGKLR